MQDIQEWNNKPTPIDLTLITKLVEFTINLQQLRAIQSVEPGESKRPDREIKHLTEIFLKCGRKILVSLIGQIHNLRDLLLYVPRNGEDFLNYSPNREIESVDEEGEYYNLTIEVGEVSFFVLESFINFHTTFLKNIQALNKYLHLVQKLGQLQPLRPELISLLSKVNIFPEVDWFSHNITASEIESQVKTTKKSLHKTILLTGPAWEGVSICSRPQLQQTDTIVQKSNRQSRNRRKRSRRNRRSQETAQRQGNLVETQSQTREISPQTQSQIETEIRNNLNKFQARLRLTLRIDSD
jgi:hypothetical protein